MIAEEIRSCLRLMDKHRERFERLGILGERATISRRLADIPVPVYRLEDRDPEEIARQERKARGHREYMRRRRALEKVEQMQGGRVFTSEKKEYI